jgi:hypothetical protein
LVNSPKASISNLLVLYDGGEYNPSNPWWTGWSLAQFDWQGCPALGIRWNGSDLTGDSHIGSPQSRGVPTWFVLPDAVAASVRAMLKFRVLFHPMSLGVSPGNRGPRGEVSSWHPTKEAALDGRSKPPLSGYIAVKILDDHENIIWEQTAGQHVAQADLRAMQ